MVRLCAIVKYVFILFSFNSWFENFWMSLFGIMQFSKYIYYFLLVNKMLRNPTCRMFIWMPINCCLFTIICSIYSSILCCNHSCLTFISYCQTSQLCPWLIVCLIYYYLSAKGPSLGWTKTFGYSCINVEKSDYCWAKNIKKFYYQKPSIQ